jgi:hypothetical protein
MAAEGRNKFNFNGNSNSVGRRCGGSKAETTRIRQLRKLCEVQLHPRILLRFCGALRPSAVPRDRVRFLAQAAVRARDATQY